MPPSNDVSRRHSLNRAGRFLCFLCFLGHVLFCVLFFVLFFVLIFVLFYARSEVILDTCAEVTEATQAGSTAN